MGAECCNTILNRFIRALLTLLLQHLDSFVHIAAAHYFFLLGLQMKIANRTGYRIAAD